QSRSIALAKISSSSGEQEGARLDEFHALCRPTMCAVWTCCSVLAISISAPQTQRERTVWHLCRNLQPAAFILVRTELSATVPSPCIATFVRDRTGPQGPVWPRRDALLVAPRDTCVSLE